MKALILTSLMMSGMVTAAEKAPQEIIDFTNNELTKISSQAGVVKAIKEQNAQKVSLDKIKQIDTKWKATAGIDKRMKSIMENSCAKELLAFIDKFSFITEAFVMDNQGANVCMSDKTSDYWQGDEAKFQKTFTGGAGSIFIDDVKFDKSSQTYVVQASLPIKEGNKAIGSITFSIDVDKFKK